MSASLTVTGDQKLVEQLAALADAVRGQAMKSAAVAGALLVVNDAKARAPYKRGNLRRSLHVGGEGSAGGLEGDTTGTDIGGQAIGADFVEVKVGTNVEYARRRELGFAGADKLGRVYHDPPTPYLRPALEAQRDAVTREAGEALRDVLRAAV